MRQARRLARRFPVTADAWRAGVVTGEHAVVITRGVEVVLRRLTRAKKAECEQSGEPFVPIAWSRELDGHRVELEVRLLELAVTWPPETIAQAVTIAVNAADPDGADQETMDAATAAKLVTKTVGSAAMTTIDHTLETAAKLRAVLDHFRTWTSSRRSRTSRTGPAPRSSNDSGCRHRSPPPAGSRVMRMCAWSWSMGSTATRRPAPWSPQRGPRDEAGWAITPHAGLTYHQPGY